jgi:hypothetical protein
MKKILKKMLRVDIKRRNNINEEMFFLVNIFWKILNDLKCEDNVRDWKIDDYVNYVESNIDRIDFNNQIYKNVFEDLIKYVVNNIKNKCEYE